MNEHPLSANDIADALKISRGKVSMGLKELQSWRLDYFKSLGRIWDIANSVFEERRKREMGPSLVYSFRF